MKDRTIKSLEEDCQLCVVEHVGIHTEQEKKEKVYNITVKDVGVFYANGVLVSNCDCLTGCCEHSGLVDTNMNLWS